jgi:uncharacterized protein (TIGR00725 family)
VSETLVYIAVCGASRAGDTENDGAAEEVGRLLAREGAVVICGGLGGVMDAVARGAESEGGVSIGILPGRDRTDQSDHLTYSIPTGMGEGRNVLVASAADALIAIGGEFGTLSEIAFALRIGVPVVGLGTWELAKHGRPVDAFPLVETPDDAVTRALDAARERAG